MCVRRTMISFCLLKDLVLGPQMRVQAPDLEKMKTWLGPKTEKLPS